MNRRGSLLLEAVFALFLLAVVALATLALLTHALTWFETAEARGRALPLAGAWLEAGVSARVSGAEPPEPDSLPVGPGFLRPGVGGAPVFEHPRSPSWPVGGRP